MGKASVQVSFQFPKLFNELQANQDRIERVIAGTIQTQVGMRFDAEGAHNGHEKWEPLKMRDGQILSLTGTLRKSMSPPGADGNPGPQGFVRSQGSVMDLLTEVGTKLIYAGTHNNGAIIRPKTKRALKYVNPSSGGVVFSMRSVIPKRNFTDLNDRDKEELNETLAGVVAEILDGA